MNGLVMLVLILGGALVQVVIPGSTALGSAKIPALAAIVVYYALARRRRDMLWAAVLAGMVQDGMGLIPFGYSSFAYCALGLMIARCKELVFVHEMITHMLLGFLMAFGATLLSFFLLTSTGLIEMNVSQAFHKAFGGALLGAVATPFVFRVCERLDRLMGLVESRDSAWQEVL